VTPQARRNYFQAMVELQVSERRSCQLAGMSRSGYRYQRVARDGDERLKADLRAIAGENPAAGYRTAWALLRREGLPINHKRVQRLWKEAGLTQPREAEAPSPDEGERAGEGHARQPRLDLRLHP